MSYRSTTVELYARGASRRLSRGSSIPHERAPARGDRVAAPDPACKPDDATNPGPPRDCRDPALQMWLYIVVCIRIAPSLSFDGRIENARFDSHFAGGAPIPEGRDPLPYTIRRQEPQALWWDRDRSHRGRELRCTTTWTGDRCTGAAVQRTEAGARPLATQGQSDVLSPHVRDMTITVAAGQRVANRLAMSQQGVAS
jgi:hypothetical protein